jgi:hypothetical protein
MYEPVNLEEVKKGVNDFVEVELTADLSHLSENQKKMLSVLIDASDMMNDMFWFEAYGEKEKLLSGIQNPVVKEYVQINYGPWERLDGNEPFLQNVGPKPAGANFYPEDMTREEFNQWDNEDKNSLYTFIRRDDHGHLMNIWYHDMFKTQTQQVADYLRQAAALADNEEFKKYLELRATALLNDDYFESDMAWMDIRHNDVDLVIGPIENYEDQLFGIKTAHEAYVLLKDQEWSKRLQHYSTLLPELQNRLPVPERYKQETPGTDSDLGAYEAIYYAGDCNAGSKTIAINLPNDEEVQLRKGSRRLQLKNTMKAKFDSILIPISRVLIDPAQQQHVTFGAFFENTMFHEVAHGLGIKETVNNKGPVRSAMKDKATTIEEGKADILGLFMVTELVDMGELEANLMDNYVTFMAGIFRSIRFGASSSHGRANLIRYNYFKEKGAFTRNEDGTFTVDFDKMQGAMNSLSERILIMQGDGDYEAASQLLEEKGIIDEDLQEALEAVNNKNIPVDIVFKQGKEVLGLDM